MAMANDIPLSGKGNQMILDLVNPINFGFDESNNGVYEQIHIKFKSELSIFCDCWPCIIHYLVPA